MEFDAYALVDYLFEELDSPLYDLGMGAAVWLIALAIPFRVVAAKAEIGWDVVGYVATLVFGSAIIFGLEDPILDRAIDRLDVWYESYDLLPWWVALALYVVSSDFASYWAHRLLHTGFFWHGHAWHHSPRYLYFLSGSRAAPLHIFVLIAPTTLAYLIFPYPEAHYVAVGQSVFQIANQHYIHSNLRFPFQRWLEYVLVTPRMHFVHHSRTRAYSDSNYGFIFSLWDRLFGTYTDPARVPSDEPLGLSYEVSNLRALLGLPPRRRPRAVADPAGARVE
jgi:sterol desaturase/sphingolipid hydroxylase (fatty acid hydroxylase superfamily)